MLERPRSPLTMSPCLNVNGVWSLLLLSVMQELKTWGPLRYSIACSYVLVIDNFLLKIPRGGELRTQKLKYHLVRTQSLNVLPFKPGVGQYIAIHATLTARDFFLASFYPSGPFSAFFFFSPKPLLIFPVLVVPNTWFLCRPAE